MNHKRNFNYGALIIIVVVVAFFHPLIFTTSGLPPTPPSDLHAQILQRVVWAGDFVSRYRAIPLWDSYMYAGTPMVGKMQAPVFYPLNWFMGFLPPVVFTNLYLVAHSLLAALFTYWLCRRWKLGVAASLTGAFCFGLGGSLVTKIYAGQMMHIGNWPWLPLHILLADRVAEKKSLRSTALLGLAWAVQFHAGHPQFFVYSSTLLGAYIIMKIYLARHEGWSRCALYYAFAGVIMAGVSAVMLVPAFEYIRLMPNSGGRSFEYTQSFAMSWTHVARLFYGIRPQYWLMSNADFWESCGYPGLTALALGATLLASKRINARTAFFLFGALATVLFGMGGEGGLFNFFYYLVPGYRIFRIPSRIMLVFSFCAAVLAALGVDRLARREADESGTDAKTVCLSLAALIMVSVIGALIFWKGSVRDFLPHLPLWLLALGGPVGCALIAAPGLRGVWKKTCAVLCLLVLVYALAFIVFGFGGSEPRWAFRQWRTWCVAGAGGAALGLLIWRPGKLTAAFACAVVLFDVALFSFPLVQTEPASISFWKSKLVARMAEDERPFRVLRRSQTIRLSHLTDARLEPISPFVDVNSLATWEAMMVGRKKRLEDFKNTLQLFNVKYLVSSGSRNLPLFDLVGSENNEHTTGAEVCLYRFRDFLERAHVVGREVKYSGEADLNGKLLRRLDRIDPAHEALVTRPRLGEKTGAYNVQIQDYRPGRMRFSLQQTRSGEALLVISENWHPGWRLKNRATGLEMKVIKVNGGQLGAYVSESCNLELFYLPKTIIVGASITGAVLLLCLALFIQPIFRPGKQDAIQ